MNSWWCCLKLSFKNATRVSTSATIITRPLDPKWFLSDETEQFFHAWKAVFGGDHTRKLLCAWHVDCALREALKDLSDKETQIQIYHYLKVLLSDNEEGRFRAVPQQFLTALRTMNNQFYAFFKHTYFIHIKQWAPCFQHYAAVSTNVYLESFHESAKTELSSAQTE